MNGPTAGALIGELAAQLAAAGVETPRREAALLVGLAAGWSGAQLRARDADPLDAAIAGRARELAARRARREPFAHLAGAREFRGREFAVSPAVLIPRPDTELLVERALVALRETRAGRLLEVGTGSGCVVISLLAETPGLRATATDLSGPALALAAQNAARHGVADRLELAEADLWPRGDERFPLIVSNPPYLASGELADLEPEVRDHEPVLALDGGADGRAVYRRLLAEAPDRLARGGRLLLEHGATQREALAALAAGFGWRVSDARDDGSGLPRLLELTRD